jgi:hypothetical protein
MHLLTIPAKSDRPRVFVHHFSSWSGVIYVKLEGEEDWIEVDGDKLLSGDPLEVYGPSIRCGKDWITVPDLMRLVTVHVVRDQMRSKLVEFAEQEF